MAYDHLEGEVKVNKYDIPVGALVFIRTRNYDHVIANYFNAPAPYPPNTRTGPYTTPYVGGGTTVSPYTHTYKPSTTTDITTTIEINTTPGDSLQELYDAYKAISGVGPNGSGQNNNGLGMSFMSNKKGKAGKLTKALKALKSSTHTPIGVANNTSSATTWTINAAGTGTVTFPATTSGPFTSSTVAIAPMKPVYKVTGYNTVEECLSWRNPVDVVHDCYTEEELEEALTETSYYPELGQPFGGIIVDKFAPKLSTTNGDEVASHLPVLYKVLIDEKNILWVAESDITPMKPKNCPLKKEGE